MQERKESITSKVKLLMLCYAALSVGGSVAKSVCWTRVRTEFKSSYTCKKSTVLCANP